MKKPTIDDLKKELEAANKRIEIQQRLLSEADKVRRLIIAAGLIDEDKFRQAEELIN
ncbi:MAG: hypothetical protein KUG81_09905 [Gammaproteobacteria bacterium]|nr:hypothetical protein [Gammaproteobacteria bacterium]